MDENKQPAPPPPQRGRRGWWWLLPGVPMLLLALVAAAPWLLSTAPGREAVLRRVNAHIAPASAAVAQWRLSWTHGLEASGIAYADPARGLDLRVERVSTSTGLWPLLRPPVKDLGRVEVVGPVFVQRPPPAPPVAPPVVPEAAPPPAPGGVAAWPAAVVPFEDVRGLLIVRDGAVRYDPAENLSCDLRDVAATVCLAGLRQPLAFSLRAGEVDGPGVCEIAGVVDLPWPAGARPADLVVTAAVTLAQCQLSTLRALAGTNAAVPAVAGRLDASLRLAARGPLGIQAAGTLRGTNVMAHGGCLGTDHPRFDTAALDFDAIWSNRTLIVRHGRLALPGASLTGCGAVLFPTATNGPPAGTLALEWTCDLGALVAQLPATLRRPDGLTVVGGVLEGLAAADFRGVGDVQARGHVAARDLAARGGLLATDQPRLSGADLVFDVARNAECLVVRQLQFTSPLASVTATGRLDAVTGRYPSGALKGAVRVDLVTLAAQLPATIRLRKGVTLASGVATLDAAVASSPEALGFSGRLQTRDLAAQLDGHAYSLEEPLDFAARGLLLPAGPSLESVTLNSSFARISGSGTASNLTMELSADLARALAEARKFVQIERLELNGQLTATMRMVEQPDGLRAVDVEAGVEDLTVAGASPQPLRLKKVRSIAKGALAFTPGGRLASGQQLSGELRTDVAHGAWSVRRLTTAREGAPLLVEGASLRAEGELATLVAFLKQAGWVQNPPVVQGGVKLDVRGGARGQAVEVEQADATISKLVVDTGKASLVEPEVQLGLAGAWTPDAVRIRRLALQSAPLSFTAGGSIGDLPRSRILQLGGELTADLRRLSALALAFAETDVDIEGRKTAPFTLKLPLAGTNALACLKEACADLPLCFDRLNLFGVEVGACDARLQLSNGLARTVLRTTLQGGRLDATLALDLRGPVPVLSLPDRSHVLDGVTLTDSLASDLLAKIHPLFKGCAVTAGSLNLDLDHFRLPLTATATRETVFAGVLSLTNVVLRPSGLLRSVLDLARVDAGAVAELPSERLRFACADGRVRTEPLTLKVDRARLTMEGNMGLDGTLDYRAEVPLSEKLVGAQAWKYLKDTRVQLRIGGTVNRPSLSADNWRANYESLVKQALQNLMREEGAKLLEKLLKEGGRSAGTPTSPSPVVPQSVAPGPAVPAPAPTPGADR